MRTIVFFLFFVFACLLAPPTWADCLSERHHTSRQGIAWCCQDDPTLALFLNVDLDAGRDECPFRSARFISLVSASRYESNGSNDASYEILMDEEELPYRGRYGAILTRGHRCPPWSDCSDIHMTTTLLELPDYIEIKYREIHHRNAKRHETIELPGYDYGYTGIVIVEILGYLSGGDNDFGYQVKTDNCRGGRGERVDVYYGFDGNLQADLIFRVTQLQWDDTLNVQAKCTGIPLAVNRNSGAEVAFDRDEFFEIAVGEMTTYWPAQLDRSKGDADDDMSFDFRIGPTDGTIRGSRARSGNLELTLYELDLWTVDY